VYNGTDQSSSIRATAQLVGEDVGAYTNYLVADFGENQFINAGTYSFSVAFNNEELANNYKLSNTTANITMKKANITNIDFSGNETWTYSNGTTKYYFATNGTGYGIEYVEIGYLYDPDTIINITYSGGEYSNSTYGLNGIKNVKIVDSDVASYEIVASVIETDNYNAWSRSITVRVEKGTIDNIYLTGYLVEDGYDADKHYLYASNTNDKAYTEDVEVKLPDGSTANIEYNVVSSYWNTEIGTSTLGWGYENNYAVDAGKHTVNARIKDHQNYIDWNEEAILEIPRLSRSVVWRYSNLETASFEYNGEDQSSEVKAYLVRAGSTAEEVRTIAMNVAFLLNDETIKDATLRTYFALAGTYTLTASFDTNDEESKWHVNNYDINNEVVEVDMDKYTIEIKWLYGCTGHEAPEEEYNSDNICVYDKETHAVNANGLGLPGANGNRKEMALVPSGTFQAVNAGEYTATIESVAEGTDIILIGGEEYSVSYSTNYKLPSNTELVWKIKQRTITITLDNENSYLSKIYDGNNTFDINSASRTEAVSKEGSIAVKTITYTFQETNYANKPNKAVYTLNNIIAGDEAGLDIAITQATTNQVNVGATLVTLTLNGLTAEHNYCTEQDITGLIYSKDVTEMIIVPYRVQASYKEGLAHVYNGMTFTKEIAQNVNEVEEIGIITLNKVKYTEQGMIIDGSIDALYDTNYFSGNFNLGGATNAGNYEIISQFDIVDVYGVHNYDFVDEEGNVIDSTTDNILSVLTNENGNSIDYVIKTRDIRVEYQNQLQSFNQTFKDIMGVVVLEESDLTDMEWGLAEDNKENRITALKALLTANGFARESVDQIVLDGIVNNWQSGIYEEYTYIVGNETTSDNGEYLLEVKNDNNNYAFNVPALQLTYLKVEDDVRYVFGVYDFQDLIEMEKDVNGLTATRENNGIGVAPTYVQKNNISGIRAEGGYNAVARTNMEFNGTYNGDGYAISDFIIYRLGANYLGLFGSLNGATIENLNVRRVNMIGGMGTIYAGVIAGTAYNSTITRTNVSANITITNASDTIYVGGLVGDATNVTFTGNSVAGYAIINGASAYFGGVAGALEVDGEGAPVVEGNAVFVDAKVEANVVSADYIVGSTSVSATENVFLQNSLLIIDVDAGTADIKETISQGTGYTYYDYSSADEVADNLGSEVIAMVNSDMMRNFIYLPHLPDATIPNIGVIDISNHRQLSLILAYGWLNYNLLGDIYIPKSLANGTEEDHFYGTFTKEDHMKIFTDTNITYNLTIVVADENYNVVVQQGA
ncbi:MAG: hypothetical protein IKB56_02310, partial [Clostridia bacterium]|nr:hypothetical protein [Clostridia bacterium]